MTRIKTTMSILVATGDEREFVAMQRELEESAVANSLIHAHDGHEVLEILTHTRRGARVPDGTIGLILCETELPDMHVSSLLETLAARTGLRRIPLFVLTGEDAEPTRWGDLQAHGADGWIHRPLDAQALLRAIRESENCWVELTVATGRRVEGDATTPSAVSCEAAAATPRVRE